MRSSKQGCTEEKIIGISPGLEADGRHQNRRAEDRRKVFSCTAGNRSWLGVSATPKWSCGNAIVITKQAIRHGEDRPTDGIFQCSLADVAEP
jgi:hypothetical protein